MTCDEVACLQGAQSLGSSPNNSASAFNRQAPGPASGAPEPSYLSNPSNMYGLMVSLPHHTAPDPCSQLAVTLVHLSLSVTLRPVPITY